VPKQHLGEQQPIRHGIPNSSVEESIWFCCEDVAFCTLPLYPSRNGIRRLCKPLQRSEHFSLNMARPHRGFVVSLALLGLKLPTQAFLLSIYQSWSFKSLYCRPYSLADIAHADLDRCVCIELTKPSTLQIGQYGFSIYGALKHKSLFRWGLKTVH